MTRSAITAVLCLVLMGCAHMPTPIVTPAYSDRPHTHAVFMDGTANDFNSKTNVMRLNMRISELPEDSVSTFYVEGVGTKSRWISAAVGRGFDDRVLLAYSHLLQNYQQGDEIYLFGFSRGAYAARIVASLVHYGGLPGHPIIDPKSADRIARSVFAAYKGVIDHTTRERRIAGALEGLGLSRQFESRPVTFLGLWDSVESLGVGRETNIEGEGSPYADQLCNVQRAAHAMSLDDNREVDFTPLLLTRPYLVAHCNTTALGEPWRYSEDNAMARLNETVDEVWFAGAHADVGGGYPDNRLNALSMNWMLAHLKAQGLLKTAATTSANYVGIIHNPQGEFFNGRLYVLRPRDLEAYAKPEYNQGRLKIHPTVVSRMNAYEVEGERSPVGLGSRVFEECFEDRNDGRYRFDHRVEGCRLTVSGLPGS